MTAKTSRDVSAVKYISVKLVKLVTSKNSDLAKEQSHLPLGSNSFQKS